MHSKLNEEKNLRKVTKSLYIFLQIPDEEKKYVNMMQSNSSHNYVHRYNIMILNLLDPVVLIDTEPNIKIKFKKILSELKKFKVQAF